MLDNAAQLCMEMHCDVDKRLNSIILQLYCDWERAGVEKKKERQQLNKTNGDWAQAHLSLIYWSADGILSNPQVPYSHDLSCRTTTFDTARPPTQLSLRP